MGSKRVSLAAGVAVLVLLSEGVWLQPARAQAAAHQDPNVVAAFDETTAYVGGISPRVLSTKQRLSLLAKLSSGRKRYVDGDVCGAHSAMNGFLAEVQGYRKAARVAVAETMYNKGRSLRDSLFDLFIADPGQPRPACFDDSVRQPPQVNLIASDNKHVTAALTLGAPQLSTAEAEGETWTEITLSGLQPQIGEPGMPALPSWQTLLAIPRGSTPVLTHRAIAIRETIKVNVYPFQPQPSDGESPSQSSLPGAEAFLDKPFTKDKRAYASSALIPAAPCAVRYLGTMRDLHIAQVQCVGGQYNPVTDELRLLGSVEFDVKFEGGDGTFSTSQSLSPFEKASLTAIHTVLNSTAASEYVLVVDTATRNCAGEELLILTYPDFRAAADNLANWKRSKGIVTTVIDVGLGTQYETGRKINRLIDNRYDTCRTRLSYVLLMGDSDLVPPARTNYVTKQEPDSTTGSDWSYATHTSFAGPFEAESFLPYFAVGRVPVDDDSYANLVVAKTIQYESVPPFIDYISGAPFYTTATIASYFQCCRRDFLSGFTWFSNTGRDMRWSLESSETLRNTLLGYGHAVQRIYSTNTDFAEGVVVVDPTPRRLYNGDPLPVDLSPASGFPWDGFTNHIVQAFETGRFLIVHRDHGLADRWAHPTFTDSHADGLKNGNLVPIVYSINCRTAYWDSETDDEGGETAASLMEVLLRDVYGMVGGIGPNRNTPSGPNNALLRGLIDATWPNLAAGFGGTVPIRRLGDILNHGKLYLATQIGMAQPGGAKVTEDNYRDQLILYHVLGDPTLEMWTSNPYQLDLSTSVDITVEDNGLVAEYPVEGAEITAVQVMANGSTRPLARSTVIGGVARLPFIAPVVVRADLGNVRLSASLSNAVSVRLNASVKR